MEHYGVRERALVALSAEQERYTKCVPRCLKAMCHTDGLVWSAREIASMALPAARERHAKNVWHIALRRGETHVEHYIECKRESFSGVLGGAREKYQMCFTLP